MRRLPGPRETILSNYSKVAAFLRKQIEIHKKDWDPFHHRDFIDSYIGEIDKVMTSHLVGQIQMDESKIHPIKMLCALLIQSVCTYTSLCVKSLLCDQPSSHYHSSWLIGKLTYQSLLLQRRNDREAGFRVENLAFCTLDMFEAGTQTMTSTLRWALLFMMKYPEVQSRYHVTPTLLSTFLEFCVYIWECVLWGDTTLKLTLCLFIKRKSKLRSTEWWDSLANPAWQTKSTCPILMQFFMRRSGLATSCRLMHPVWPGETQHWGDIWYQRYLSTTGFTCSFKCCHPESERLSFSSCWLGLLVTVYVLCWKPWQYRQLCTLSSFRGPWS